MRRVPNVLAFFLGITLILAAPQAKAMDPLSIYGDVTLIDEVDVSKTSHDFEESPKGASKVVSILGKPHRVLPNTHSKASRFSYRIGAGKGLKPNDPYVLVIDYPEDAPRAFFIHYTGAETHRGIATGQASADVVMPKYVNNNSESLKYPLSKKSEVWSNLFFLHDKFVELKIARAPKIKSPTNQTPDKGFRVAIAQPATKHQPISQGAAISRIRLYKVNDEAALKAPMVLPPEGLPKRHIFWREEMSDGVIGRGVDGAQWYEQKMRLMKFLGINTFTKDLLEFGHNQGWDSSIYGGNAWVYQSKTPKLWQQILDKAAQHNVTVFPYYEYVGSVGQKSLGREKRAKTLGGGDTYTHIKWSEKANADITDPDTVEDLKNVFRATIIRHKDKVDFLGAWLRPRSAAIPVSFSDRCLGLFAKEANNGTAPTRAQLKSNKVLYGKYLTWWYKKRADFLNTMQTWLAKELGKDAYLLYTTDPSEPGESLKGNLFVTDDPGLWQGKVGKSKVTSFDDVVNQGLYYKSMISPRGTWAQWEWQHAVPHVDPWNYKDSKYVNLSYSYSRLYTVSDEKAFDNFRNGMGLAMLRHHSLNENMMDHLLGYFSCDVELAGPYTMLTEATAMAKGDPRFLGTLAGHTYNRGFPQYVRNFNTNFLALPALPSTVLKGAASNTDVWVREIKTKKHGTYYAVVNIGFASANNVKVSLPASGKVKQPTTGKTVKRLGKSITLDLYPGQLVALHVK